MELPNFRHFFKSGVTQANMAGIWAEDNSEPSTCTIYTNSLDSLSELNHPVGHHWLFGGIDIVARDTTDLVLEAQTHCPCALGFPASKTEK